MTCRAQTAPPLPREIRESPYMTVRPDGSALVLVSDGETVTCPDCRRGAAMVIVRGTRYRCVECDG